MPWKSRGATPTTVRSRPLTRSVRPIASTTTAETRLPEPVRDDDYQFAAGTYGIAGLEQSADGWRQTERRKIVAGDEQSVDAFDPAGLADVERNRAEGEQAAERALPLGEIAVLEPRRAGKGTRLGARLDQLERAAIGHAGHAAAAPAPESTRRRRCWRRCRRRARRSPPRPARASAESRARRGARRRRVDRAQLRGELMAQSRGREKVRSADDADGRRCRRGLRPAVGQFERVHVKAPSNARYPLGTHLRPCACICGPNAISVRGSTSACGAAVRPRTHETRRRRQRGAPR